MDEQRQIEDIANAQEALLKRMEGSNLNAVKYKYIPWICVTVDVDAFTAILRDSEVTAMMEDAPLPAHQGNDSGLSLKGNLGALSENTAAPVKAMDMDELDDIVSTSRFLGSDETGKFGGYDGTGWTVAIIDSGVDKNHSALSGKVVSEACYSTNEGSWHSVCPGGAVSSTAEGSAMPYGGNCPAGLCDHGTAVASIAAGKFGTHSLTFWEVYHTTISFSGMANAANIIAIQVRSWTDSDEMCESNEKNAPCTGALTGNLSSALERVYTLRDDFNIAAVNISLGKEKHTVNCDDDPLADAINLGSRLAEAHKKC